MVNVIGVRFRNDGKLYFFDPGSLWPTPGDYVIVETSRGVEFAETVTTIKEIDESGLDTPLRPVIRIATADDVQHNEENRKAEREAHAVCQRKIAEHKLDMKLVRVEYTFDNSKILFYFTANGRVDFRGLVKDLAGQFKTRIELRQIGVRDEAKMLGGLGPCGRQICCGAFLSDFQPVSIKMAKEQSLSLNPTKISGICGRLMCCLKYEQDQYEAVRKQMPKVGKEVVTPDGNGVVSDLNIIRETVRVRIRKGDGFEMRDYPMADVQRVGQQPRVSEAEETNEPREVKTETAAEENVTEVQASATAQQSSEQTSRPRREKPAKHRREDAAPAAVRSENQTEAPSGMTIEQLEGKARRPRESGEIRRRGNMSIETIGAPKSADKKPDEKKNAASETPVKVDSLQAPAEPPKPVAEAPKVAAEPAKPAFSWKDALAKAMADASGNKQE